MMLKDRVAIVTGGGSGIGRATCLGLAAEGASVAVADLNEPGAQAVASEIAKAGGQGLAAKVDVANGDSVRAMVKAVVARFGRVDVLVNNAGWDKIERFVDSTEDTWDKVLAINLKGQILCARAVLDDMIPRQSGRIVNIASDAGRVGSSGECVYGAAKGGVIAFTKGLAREVARFKINVNCVCPGPTDTPLFAQVAAGNPKLADALKKAIPWGRLGRPEDIARAVAFFASDAAEYVTGQTLSVSGGLTMV